MLFPFFMKCREYLCSFVYNIRRGFLQLSKEACRLELNDSIPVLDTSMLTVWSIYPTHVTPVLEHLIFFSAFTLIVLTPHFWNQNQGPSLVLEIRVLNCVVDVGISNLPNIAQGFSSRKGALNLFPHVQSSCPKGWLLSRMQDCSRAVVSINFIRIQDCSSPLKITRVDFLCSAWTGKWGYLCACMYVNGLHTNHTLVFLSACRDLQTDQ